MSRRMELGGSIRYEGGPERVPGSFVNTGVADYRPPNRGLFEHTNSPEDLGKFRVPSLRNVAVTAPYMHDGSIATLEEVVEHYAAGGRTIAAGANAGVGSDSPLKDPFVAGFVLSAAERADLVAFLRGLTD